MAHKDSPLNHYDVTAMAFRVEHFGSGFSRTAVARPATTRGGGGGADPDPEGSGAGGGLAVAAAGGWPYARVLLNATFAASGEQRPRGGGDCGVDTRAVARATREFPEFTYHLRADVPETTLGDLLLRGTAQDRNESNR